MSKADKKSLRNLVLVFGDQLDAEAGVFKDFDATRDAVWMAEVEHESTYVWSHKQRIALFLAAMRHFRDELEAKGIRVFYRKLDDQGNGGKFSTELERSLKDLQPEKVLFTRPGEWRVLQGCEKVLKNADVDFEMFEDDHFFTTPAQFDEHAEGRKSLRMEFFYRELRKETGILMTKAGKPEGDAWNFDKENRGSFGKAGPPSRTTGPVSQPDEVTKEVLELVEKHFPKHPGSLAHFQWPVTRRSALHALKDFIKHRLPDFGTYQDAMWTDAPWLYHAWLGSSLNLKLLNPREVVSAAEAAYYDGDAPLAAVEGFIRQILGWREYVRGVYWKFMPDYLERNFLQADAALPDFYWTGKTEYACLQQSIGQTLEYGYAHHIQRLMVTGLYALLLGVNPKSVHEWYLAVYVDAVEWVELPNVLGMSQYGDGGVMASKPYAATGKYIQRMSNYCSDCPKNPAKRTGEDACPFTTLYWDFLLRNEKELRKNQRMSLQVRNIDRIDEKERAAIRAAAKELKG